MRLLANVLRRTRGPAKVEPTPPWPKPPKAGSGTGTHPAMIRPEVPEVERTHLQDIASHLQGIASHCTKPGHFRSAVAHVCQMCWEAKAARPYRLVFKDGVPVKLGTLDVRVNSLDELVVFRTRKAMHESEVATLRAAVEASGRIAVVVSADVEVLELVPVEEGA